MALVEERPVADRAVVASVNPVARIVYVIVGIIEALLAFRFVFLLLGANSAAGFVDFIYRLTDPLVAPFYGIFPEVSTRGLSQQATFDPATLVAMAVYGLVGWAIVRLTGGYHRV